MMTNPKTKREEREGGINADAVKTTICWGLCAKASTCSVSPVNSFCNECDSSDFDSSHHQI